MKTALTWIRFSTAWPAPNQRILWADEEGCVFEGTFCNNFILTSWDEPIHELDTKWWTPMPHLNTTIDTFHEQLRKKK